MSARPASCVLALVLVLVLGSACGPDVAPSVDCEARGATKLLSLRDDSLDTGDPSQVIRDERGWLVVVDGRGLAIECGAAPREFARDIAGDMLPVAKSGGAWIATDNSRDPDSGHGWVALDPWGEREPLAFDGELLARGDGAVATGTRRETFDDRPELWRTVLEPEREFTTVEVPYALPAGELGELSHWEYSDTLLESDRPAFGVAPLADGSDHVGVEIDIDTGNVTALGGPAFILYVTDDLRFVVVVPFGEEDVSRIVERHTGRTMPLGGPGWAMNTYELGDPSVVTAQSVAEERTHVVFLPGLEEAWLDGLFETELGWVAEDGRRMLESVDGLHLIAPGETVATPLFPRGGDACIAGDVVYLRERFDHRGLFDRILRIPLDGSPVETVIEGPVGTALPLVDGRWALLRDDGVLRFLDPRTGAETEVVHGVESLLGDSLSLEPRRGCAFWTEVAEPHAEIRYVARDRDGALALWSYDVR